MKREIKFRGKIKAKDFRVKLAMAGKPKNEGEWAYGDIHLQSIIPHIHEGMDKYPIDVDTLGQFTGLHDKNGNEIYEGDIMQYNSLLRPEKYYRYVIAWNPIEMAFGCASLDHAFLDCPDICGGAQITDSTIIGNIHDNPELLKGGAE